MGSYRELNRTTCATVGIWECHDPEPGAHEAEIATAHAIILPVRGAYVRHADRSTDLGDCTRVLFENPGEAYRVTHPVAGGDRCTVLTLAAPTVEWLAEQMRWHGYDPVFPATSAPASSSLFILHRRLTALMRSRIEGLELDALLYEIVGSAVRDLSQAPRPLPAARRHAQAAVLRSLELLHARFREDLSLDDVAQHAAYTPFHLTRLFKRHVGTTIHRFVTQLRLRAAFDAIMDSADDLTGVALTHGFSSHSHFTTAFRREFGVTPSEVRAMDRRAREALPREPHRLRR